MKIDEYVRGQIKDIVAWEAEEPWLVTKVINRVTAPLAWGIKKVIPKVAIEGIVISADWVASLTTREKWVLGEAGVDSFAAVRELPLQKLDAMADSVHNWAITTATAEGGIAGAAGLPGMVLDIPAVIGQAFRLIRQVGLCYGYETKTDEDFSFCLEVLSLAGAASMKEKTGSLATLKSMETTLKKVGWKAMEKVAKKNPATREAFLLALKKVAEQLGFQLTKKKALQAVPIIGAAVGATSNLAFIRSVGWAARRAYQRRLLEEHGLTIVDGRLEER
ncbi:EcsC family protein [Sphingomonas aerolata]|uniref:EcsC family protein n=1 Tax=Sphingomonas aerolata TaxID=185951 RepID=A0A2T4YMP5_9SPHN|nr:EcsC family protein [Sphingomonas aerolata]PTM44678.1 EcsC family protein [Sphingomonas aerolata]